MDALALKFHETKDLKVRDEIWRLSRELIKLDERGCLWRLEGPTQTSLLSHLLIPALK
jgi:hypothetical protein